MCGRFALFASGDELVQRFQLPEALLLDARYNVAPTQNVAAVRLTSTGRALARLRWGLIPSWSKDQAIANKLLNARAETVEEKPSFRSAFKKRRCLIPASGYYEWQKVGRTKQPHFIRSRDGRLLAFAGLWEQWHDPSDNALVESCTILTTTANDALQHLHERMPVIIDPSADAQWLDSDASPDELRALLIPYPNERLEAIEVGSWVSNVRNQGSRCLEPAC
jgi:putative SOS response-associated peptidase YedK